MHKQRNKIKVQAFPSLFGVWLTIVFVFVSTGQSASLAVFSFDFKPSAFLPGQGAINVQRPDNDGALVIEIILNLGMIKDPSDVGKRINSIALDKIRVWALAEHNSSLPFIKAFPPMGVGNAGSADAHLFFHFSCPKAEKPIAVAVKILDEYRIFGIPAKQ